MLRDSTNKETPLYLLIDIPVATAARSQFPLGHLEQDFQETFIRQPLMKPSPLLLQAK